MEIVTKILAVGLGGAIGAIVRHCLNLLIGNNWWDFPLATFLINISGSFLIGFLLFKFEANETMRLLLVTGFLGAYTTFSTFEYETFQLTQSKQLFIAFLYVSLSFAVGFLGVAGGIWLAKKF